MRFRKLRIAWSAGWGIAAALFVVLWVRSYWADISATRLSSSSVMTSVGANAGRVYCLQLDLASRRAAGIPFRSHGWELAVDPDLKVETSPGFAWNSTPLVDIIQAPAWFVALVVAVLATIPWASTRFSLRTLLIVTTVVAVVLGAIIYAVR